MMAYGERIAETTNSIIFPLRPYGDERTKHGILVCKNVKYLVSATDQIDKLFSSSNRKLLKLIFGGVHMNLQQNECLLTSRK